MAKIKKRENKRKGRTNWITDAIIKSCETKEFLYNLWQMDLNNNQLKPQYKTYAKILDKVITDAKIKYEMNLVKNNANNQKQLWKIINTKIGKNTNENSVISYIKIDNNKISDKAEIAKHMNRYFCEIGRKLSDNIVKPPNAELRLTDMNANSIFLRQQVLVKY